MSGIAVLHGLEPNCGICSREFRVAKEYERCCFYVTIGGAISTVLLLALPLNRANGGALDDRLFLAAAGIMAAALTWIYARTWRMRLDERGIWRRRLWFWSCWEWEAFEDGRIVLQEDGKLVYRQRPLWDRWLVIPLVSDADRKFLNALFSRLVRRPPAGLATTPSEAPTSISLGALVRRFNIDSGGVEVPGWRSKQFFSWDEIEYLRVFRHLPNGVPSYWVELRLCGGRTIKGLAHDVNRKSLSGRDRQHPVWLDALGQIVPECKWQRFRTSGELSSRAEGEFRIEFWAKQLVGFQWIGRIGVPLMLAAAVWQFGPKLPPIVNAPFLLLHWKVIAAGCILLTAGMPCFLIWLTASHCMKRVRETIQEIREELASLEPR